MKRAISLRRSEHRGGLLMAMFEFGFNKVSVVRSDLAFEHLSKGQDLIDLGRGQRYSRPAQPSVA